VGVANLFLGQPIGIDEKNTLSQNFYSSMQTVGATVLGGLWALEWASTLLKQTCAAQEAQEYARQGPIA